MHRHALVHAYGHVSIRLDAQRFLVSPAQPLGTVAAGDAGVEVSLDGPLPDGALPEVRIHREIYRRRPSVDGICRFQSPAVMALSALGETPRALHGSGTYFAPAPPFWSDVALVRDDERAAKLAALMGDASAIVMRGNGAVTAAPSLEAAAGLAYLLEDAARIEVALLPMRHAEHGPLTYTAEQSAQRATSVGGLFERMWHFLSFGDPEC